MVKQVRRTFVRRYAATPPRVTLGGETCVSLWEASATEASDDEDALLQGACRELPVATAWRTAGCLRLNAEAWSATMKSPEARGFAGAWAGRVCQNCPVMDPCHDGVDGRPDAVVQWRALVIELGEPG
ncbi:hypothetical protein [Embleya sp. NPDC059237]|uniref:hypothetical protein n=1 Tax=Embleya sp. NPDC059237 TaxID=3346784 RepID=UPI00367F70B5